ncbi:FadR family transcriptional regulator [Candidimonas humi]|uniref:FadR/GntR family transcriptional regulator n=1 Tax=Candidimonas humi TaxID=683355 RepID=A0ABV8NZF3_9BURK|nr:FadR/GntR family transcriptional regulator [Candidimonas humi]MBV6306611.1 FadR family transcriptional regulator [Candidimonas humi]
MSSTPPAAGTARLDIIEVPKSCDMLANKLREQILDGTIADGSMLPPERDLVQQTGLSRGSVREGLRILEAEGLIKTRSGRYGGSTVTRPSGAMVSNQINLYARVRGIPLESIVQAREALEPALARLAAINRTEEDLQLLRDISRRIEAAYDDVPTYLDENVQWHCALAQASHNELLHTFTVSIAQLIREATDIKDMATTEIRATVIQAHERILQAIADRAPDVAERRMQRHVQAYAKRVHELTDTESHRNA